MKHTTYDLYEIMALLFNNEKVYIELPFDDESGMMVSRSISHFHGYKQQPSIEVRYYEKESDGGNYLSYATEYFSVYNIENAALAVLDRYNSADALELSTRSKDFEQTFEKE